MNKIKYIELQGECYILHMAIKVLNSWHRHICTLLTHEIIRHCIYNAKLKLILFIKDSITIV